MKKNNMAISNQIFEHFRLQEEKKKKAVNFLRRHGYSVKKTKENESNREKHSH
jgi:hypothetical protein|tara:strand:+ start:1007 stop:1165 length:159 start_codon:yes stop_codon:yes gene_type:complete